MIEPAGAAWSNASIEKHRQLLAKEEHFREKCEMNADGNRPRAASTGCQVRTSNDGMSSGLYGYRITAAAADASSRAAERTGRLDTRPPIGRALALPDLDSNRPIPGSIWAVEVDKHGRIWTTALTSTMTGRVHGLGRESYIAPHQRLPRSTT